MLAPVHQTVAEKSEIRAWVLKAFWAERHGDIDEAHRCFQWVLRLDGDNPEAQETVAAFLERHRAKQ